MSNTVDNRVVEMVFDNAQFEKGVATTIHSLESLDKSLGLIDGKELGNKAGELVQNATELDKVADAIENSKSKVASALESFSGLFGGFVFDVSGIANGIMNALNSTFNFQGGFNRALNIENAKFQLKGLGVAWRDISDDINYAVQDTAYGLDAAAKAASQFVASGVSLGEDMKQSLRGISGVAAMTNSSYDEIANIFTRIAGQGRVMAVDLNSLAARGLNAAAILAEAFGTDEAAIREMVSAGEIGFQDFASVMDEAFGEHAKKANETFNGALSNMNAAWSRFWALFLGGTDTDDEGNITATGGGILNMMRRVFLSIKQVVSDLGKVFEPIADLLQPVTNAVGDFAEGIADTISSMWTEVVETGEYAEDGTAKTTKVLAHQGVEAFHIFQDIGNALTGLIRPIKAFFDALLPTKDEFLAWVDSIRDVNLIHRLNLTEGAVKMLETAFSAIGALLKNIIGPAIYGIGAVLDSIIVIFIVAKDALDTFFDAIWDVGSRGFDAFVRNIGEIKNPLDSFWQAVNDSKFSESALFKFLQRGGELISEFFGIIDHAASNSLRMPWDELGAKLEEIVKHFLGILDETGSGDFAKVLENGYFKPIKNLADGIKTLFDNDDIVQRIFGGLGQAFGSFVNGLSSFAGIIFGILGDVVAGFLNSLGAIWDVINGLKDGLGYLISSAVNGLGELGSSLLSGLLGGFGINFAYAAEVAEDSSGKINDSVGSLTDAIASSPLGTLVGELGKSFSDFSNVLHDHAPTIEDWIGLFSGVRNAIGDFVAWLDPIGRLQTAITTIKAAFEDFGSDNFVGWGDKFLSTGHPLASLLNTVSETLSHIWQIILDHLPTGEEATAMLQKIGDGLSWVIEKLSPLIEGLARLTGTLIADAIDFISRFFDKLTKINSTDFSGIGDSIGGLFENFNSFTKSIAQGDFNIFDAVAQGLGSLGSAFGSFAKMFLPETAYAAEVVSDTSEKISGISIDGMENVVTGVKSITSDITGVSSDLANAGNSFQDGGDQVVKAFKWVQDNLALTAGVIAGGVMYIAVFKTLKTFRETAGAIAEVSGSIKNLVTGLSQKFGLVEAAKSKMQQLRDLILSLVALVAAVAILSFFPPQMIWPAVGVLAALMGLMAGLMAFISWTNKNLKPAEGINYMGIAAEISAISGALLLMTVSLAALSFVAAINGDGLLGALFIMGGMITGLAALAHVLSKSAGKDLLFGASALMVMGLALVEFAAVIIIFTLIPWGLLGTGIATVVIMISGLITAAGLLHKFAPKLIESAAGLIAMAAALYLIAGAIILLNNFGGDNLLADTAVFITMLASLVAALLVLDKFGGPALEIQSLATSLIMVSASFAIMAGAIIALTRLSSNIDEAIVAAISLGVLFGEVATALIILSRMTKTAEDAKNLAIVAGSLILVASAMAIVGYAIGEILAIGDQADELLAASVGLSLAFAAMSIALGALASAISSNTINPAGLALAAAGIIAMAGAMYILASGLNKMADVPWENVMQIVLIMALMMGFGALAGITVAVAIGVVALGGAMLMAGTGVYFFAEGIKTLAENLGPFADAIDEFLSKMITTMRDRFPEAIDTFIQNLHTLAERAPEIMNEATQVMISVVTGMADAFVKLVPVIGDSLVRMMESSVEWMDANAGQLQSAITGFAKVIGTMIADALLAIPSLFEGIFGTIGDAIIDAATNKEKQAADAASKAYADEYATMMPKDLKSALDKLNLDSVMPTIGNVDFAGGSVMFDTRGSDEQVQRLVGALDTLKARASELIAAGVYTRDEIDAILQKGEDLHIAEVGRYADAISGNQELNSTLETQAADLDNVAVSGSNSTVSLTDGFGAILDKIHEVTGESSLSMDQLVQAITDVGGGDLWAGFTASMGDASGLVTELKDKFSVDLTNAFGETGDGAAILSGLLGEVFNQANISSAGITDLGETARWTGDDIATMFASGIDIDAVITALDTIENKLRDLLTAFNNVNIKAVGEFNSMAVKIAQAIGRAQSSIGNLVSYTRTAIAGVKNALSSSGVYSSAYNTGYYVSSGFANGISAGRYLAVREAQYLASSVKSKVNEVLSINSPSKVFMEIGGYVAEGFAIGIRQNAHLSSESASQMGTEAEDALRLTMGNLAMVLDSADWETQPVIRPVLDASNVEAGVGYIGRLFGSSPMLQAAYAGPRGGRVVSSNSSRVYQISVGLNYQAGTDANRMVNDIANGLAMKLNLEA